jgi:hypothetical protein
MVCPASHILNTLAAYHLILLGHVVVQLRLIMHIVPTNPRHFELADRFLCYVQRFDIVSQGNGRTSSSASGKGPYPDPASGMYVLKRARRILGTNHTLLGDIVPLNQVRSLVELTPRFGEQADWRLTNMNALAYCSEFFLDKFFTKETFYALTLDRKYSTE